MEEDEFYPFDGLLSSKNDFPLQERATQKQREISVKNRNKSSKRQWFIWKQHAIKFTQDTTLHGLRYTTGNTTLVHR